MWRFKRNVGASVVVSKETSIKLSSFSGGEVGMRGMIGRRRTA